MLAEAARAWTAAGLGPVIGITASRSASNTLAAAGMVVSYNSAQFLGHLPVGAVGENFGAGSAPPALPSSPQLSGTELPVMAPFLGCVQP